MHMIARSIECGIRIQEKKVPGGFPGEDNENKGKYVRVMKNIDVSEESNVDKVITDCRSMT